MKSVNELGPAGKRVRLLLSTSPGLVGWVGFRGFLGGLGYLVTHYSYRPHKSPLSTQPSRVIIGF